MVKQAGHKVPRYKAPRSNASNAALTRYAERRNISAFVFGVSERRRREGWKLRLTVRGPDGELLADGLEYEADSYGGLVRAIKGNGTQDLNELLSGGSAPSRRELELDPEPPARRPGADALEAGDAAYEVNIDELGGAKPDPAPASKRKKGRKKKASLFGQLSDPASDSLEPQPPAAEPAPEPAPAISDEDFLLAADEGDDATDDGGDAEGKSDDHPLLHVTGSVGMVSRELSYAQNIYQRLRDQNSNAWTYRVQMEFFPFAGPLRERLSLVGGVASALAGSVRDSESQQDFDINYTEYFVGLRIAQPVAKHRLIGEVTFGGMSAGLDDDEGVARVPEYGYTLVTASLGGELRFEPLAVTGSVGYQSPLAYGAVSDDGWFPRVEGQGVEARGGVEYHFTPSIGLLLSGALRRITLDMNSEPEDAIDGTAEVAGGATDTYLSVYGGLAFTL